MYMQSGSFTFLISKYGRTQYIGGGSRKLGAAIVFFRVLLLCRCSHVIVHQSRSQTQIGTRLIISQCTSSHAGVECGNETARESTVNKLRSSHALQRQKGSFSHPGNLDGLFLSQRVGDSRRKLLSRSSGGGSQVSLSDVLEIWQT